MSFPRSSLHPLIDSNDLHTNGKLLREDEIAFIKKLLAREESAVFSKEKIKELIEQQKTSGLEEEKTPDLSLRISKIKNPIGIDDEYFAIYKGMKKGKALGVARKLDAHYTKALLAQDLQSGELYAMKVIPWSNNNDPNNEFRILNILGRTRGHAPLKKKRGSKELENGNKIYLIDKLAHGKNLAVHLIDHLHTVHRLNKSLITPSEWLEICYLITKAVRELHKIGIIHRDLKLENIMYDQEFKTIKLIDFEFAYLLDYEHQVISDANILGTIKYLAPEIKAHKFYDEKTDIFALGELFKELLGYSSCDGNRHVYYINRTTRSALCQYDLDIITETLLAHMTLPDRKFRSSLETVESELNYIKFKYADRSAPTPLLREVSALNPSSRGFFSTSRQGQLLNQAAEEDEQKEKTQKINKLG